MKWTDLALVFCMIFLSFAVPSELSASTRREVLFTTEQYNRMLDRAVEDALTDAVLYEGESGARLDEQKVLQQYAEELAFLFAAKTGEDRSKIYGCIRAVILTQGNCFTVYEPLGDTFGQQPFLCVQSFDGLSSDTVREVLESYLPGKLSLAEIKNEEWYQNIMPLECYVVFENEDAVFPQITGAGESHLEHYVRICRSAARIRKTN